MNFYTMKPIYLRPQSLPMGKFMSGRIQSIQADSTESFVEIIDQLDTEDNESLIFISRYPAARLLDLLDISEIQCYWLTNIQSKGAINPSLEKLNHFTESTIREGRGMLLIEGMEWLASLHGFDAVHSMLRSLSEKVVLSQWSIYISISDSSFNQRELSRILREAPMRQFNDVVEINEQGEEPFVISNNIPQSEHVELDLNDDGTPKLVFLTRLPRSGFSKQILQRRILQWRRMGLDTSDIESSLYSNEIDTMYAKYAAVEEKIRRATELERFVISSISDTQERTIALFRIRQLTGLDELEAEYFLD